MFQALIYLDVYLVSVINNTSPLFSIILSAIMLNETITFERFLIFFCSFGGVVLIIDPRIFFSADEDNESVLGGLSFVWLFLVFFAAALKAFLSIVLKKGGLTSG